MGRTLTHGSKTNLNMLEGIIIHNGTPLRKYVFEEWLDAKNFIKYWKLHPHSYAFKNTVYMPA